MYGQVVAISLQKMENVIQYRRMLFGRGGEKCFAGQGREKEKFVGTEADFDII